MICHNSYLKPIVNKLHVQKNFFGFDVETKNDNKDFLLGCVVNDDSQKFFYDRESMEQYFIENKGLFIATNLEFDANAVFKKGFSLYPFKPFFRGGRMIMGDCEKSRFADTMNFWPVGVKRLGDFLDIPKMASPDFSKIPKTRDEWDYWKRYNSNDAYISFKFWEYLQKSMNGLGGSLKKTIGSSAMDLYKRKYLKYPLRRTSLTDFKQITKAYFGGRCEVFKRGRIRNMNYYDFRSLYPSVMAANEYPDPNSMRYLHHGLKRHINDLEGVSQVKIEVPDTYYPLLPFLNDRLLFASGMIKGWYSHVELRKALDLGCKIVRIGPQYAFSRTFAPFKDFVNDLFKLRMRLQKENNPLELMVKIIMNSLYGKFAQKPQTSEVVYLPPLEKVKIEKVLMECDSSQLCHDYAIVKKTLKDEKIPAYTIPILSIYTTAYARIKLFDTLIKSKAVYCDTDSIITSRTMFEGDGLGMLKLEKRIKEGIIIRPKMYELDDNVKLKGFHHANINTFNKIMSHESVSFGKFAKFKETLHRADKTSYFNQPMTLSKDFGVEDEKRSWSESFDPETLQDSKPFCLIS